MVAMAAVPSKRSYRKVRDLKKWWIHASVFWMTVCFSLYAVIGRQTQEARPPVSKLFTFILLRQSLGALLLLILARLREGPLPSCVKAMAWRLVVCGWIGIGLSQMFFLFGERFTTATTAVTFEPIVPIVTGAVGFVFGTETLTRLKMLGSGVAICGAIVTARGSAPVNSGETQSSLTTQIGILFCIGQVICIAVYLVGLKTIPNKEKYPLWITFSIVCSGALLTSAVFFVYCYILAPSLSGNPSMHTFDFEITTMFVYEVGFAVVFATVQNYLIRTRAATALSASEIGIYLTLNPPLTALAAHVFLKETIQRSEIYGSAIVALGLWVYLSGNSHPKPRSLPKPHHQGVASRGGNGIAPRRGNGPDDDDDDDYGDGDDDDDDDSPFKPFILRSD